MISHDRRGTAQLHDCDFYSYLLQGFLVLNFDDSASVMVTILLFSVENIENLTHGAFSELLIKHEIRGWILLNKLNVLGDLHKLL